MNFIEILESSNYKPKSFPKGTVIFHEGETCYSIGLVKSGFIRIQSYSSQGNEIVYNEVSQNQFFGNHLIFSDDPYYRGDVVAIEDSLIFLIDRNEFQKLIQGNKEFFKEFMKTESEFVKRLNQHIQILTLSNAEERFLFYLNAHHGKVSYRSITALAQSIHLERETLSRLLSSLEKRHLIRRLSHQIISVN